jgi:hypothetical protein
VHRQAQTALEASDVVLEEVWILVEVDCLKCELSETLATVSVRGGLRGDTTAAELGACAILSRVSYMLLGEAFGSLPGSPSLRVSSGTSIKMKQTRPMPCGNMVYGEGG